VVTNPVACRTRSFRAILSRVRARHQAFWRPLQAVAALVGPPLVVGLIVWYGVARVRQVEDPVWDHLRDGVGRLSQLAGARCRAIRPPVGPRLDLAPGEAAKAAVAARAVLPQAAPRGGLATGQGPARPGDPARPARAPVPHSSKAGVRAVAESAQTLRREQIGEARQAAHASLVRLAELDLAAGDAAAALQACEAAATIQPKAAVPWLLRGRALERLGKTDGAVSAYYEALQRDRNLGEAHWRLGAVFSLRGKTDVALAHFREATRRCPDMPQAHYSLGVLLGRSGRPEEGLAELLRARELDPTLPEVDRNLALLYAAVAYAADDKADHYLKALPPDVRRSVGREIGRLRSQGAATGAARQKAPSAAEGGNARRR